jgi:hypothetical protein
VVDDEEDQLPVEERELLLDELPQLPPRGRDVVRLTVVREGNTASASTEPAARPIVLPEPVE